MKNLGPAALVALAIVIHSLLGAEAQQAGGGGGADVCDVFAVDTFVYAQDYTMGREIGTVYAQVVSGEPFKPPKIDRQEIGLAQLLALRGKQGYRLLAYQESDNVEWPKDGHYSVDRWKSNVRLVWGKRG